MEEDSSDDSSVNEENSKPVAKPAVKATAEESSSDSSGTHTIRVLVLRPNSECTPLRTPLKILECYSGVHSGGVHYSKILS